VIFRAHGQPLPSALLQAIVRHRPTFVSAVPWLLEAWKNMSPSVSLDALKSIRALLVGGAPLDEEVAEFFLSRGVPLMQSAGMTETAASLFTGKLLPLAQRDAKALREAYPLRPHRCFEYEIVPITSAGEGETQSNGMSLSPLSFTETNYISFSQPKVFLLAS
jgi:acyl-coenzyme A synthetase/AMP-(fatty) acid ligase